MLRFEIRSARELGRADIAAWTALLADGNPAPSPYLTPEFFQAVARVRQSARVLIGHADGRPALFLPFHRGGLKGAAGLGHPIGGPVSDVQGVIARADLHATFAADTTSLVSTTLKAAGLNLLPMAHVPASDPVFRWAPAAPADRHAFHVMDLTDGFAAYEQARLPFAKSAFKAIRTRLAKAEAQYGPVTHRFHDTSPASLAALLSWKTAQFAATGQINVLDVAWVRALVDDLRSGGNPSLKAQISSLSFGDRLVAVHLGLRTATTLHYWFPAYDPEVQDLSPGNLLLHRMAEAAAGEGVRQIHLGSGDYRYKHEFANCGWPMRRLVALGAGWPGRLIGAGQGLLDGLERRLPAALAHKPAGAFRRLDRHLAFKAL